MSGRGTDHKPHGPERCEGDSHDQLRARRNQVGPKQRLFGSAPMSSRTSVAASNTAVSDVVELRRHRNAWPTSLCLPALESGA